MPTLAAIRQRALELEPELGRTVPVTGAATNSITALALAVGTIGAARYKHKWLVRPDSVTAAGADRVRFSMDYNAANGMLPHEGAAYTDVTATDEKLEIHEHEPHMLDNHVQQTLRTTRFLDRSVIPSNLNGDYFLNVLPWIVDPSDIIRIGVSHVPFMTRNRHMEKWNGYSTAGVLVPDEWTLAGTAATFARVASTRLGAYSFAITTTGGNVATVDAVVPVMRSGVSNDSLRGQIVTGVAVSRSGAASSQRVRVTSENAAGTVISTTNSSFHTGGSYFEELSAAHTVATTAERVKVQFRQEQNETTQHLDELYLMVGAITDSQRRDHLPITWWDRMPLLEQGQPLLLHFERRSNAQVVIESQRPYAAFDSARVAAGTADLDVTDAPLDLIAHGALWRLYEGLGDIAKARRHFVTHKQLQAQHFASENDGRGFELNRPTSRISARVGR